MGEGYTKAEAKEIQKQIEEMGWSVEMNNLDAVKRDDSVWWYEYDIDSPILSVENKDNSVAYILVADGDISITDPENGENHFYFEGGRPDTGEKDDLTEDLVKRGVWDNNNWFEVIREVYNPKTKEYKVDNNLNQIDDPAEVYIKDAVEKFINFLKLENKNKKR